MLEGMDYVISDDDMDALRAIVGDAPTDSELHIRYERLGNIYLVAHEVLVARLNALLMNPAQFSVPGYSENNSANINALRSQILSIETSMDRLGLGIGSSITSTPLVRVSSRR